MGGGGGGGGTGGDRTPRETDLGSDISLSVRSAIPDAPSTASSRALSTSLASSVSVQSPAIEFSTIRFLESVSTPRTRQTRRKAQQSQRYRAITQSRSKSFEKTPLSRL